MRCSNCGKNLEEGTKFCPVCGNAVPEQTHTMQEPPLTPLRPQAEMHFCPKCGSVVPLNARFCAACGNEQRGVQNTNSVVLILSRYKMYIAIAAVLLVVVILVIAIVSNKDTEKDSDDKSDTIVGTWELVGGYNDNEYVELDEDDRTEWEFKSNNKLRIDDQIGTYTIDDDILTISSKDYDDEDSFRIVKVTRKKLVLEKIGGLATQVVFERQ
ncbi:zinc-ribbon domain-containing protein [Ruminococcus sp. 210702-SL.1.03]|uniref:zinc-ribbon domain-containing protein n=1 Tax=Ruminococcus sp. 210702-SL.1.03 TaxID=2883233 RepID=UPI001D070CA2|nr:zinc-ribbon domain-containing protein [Ruminococcus sp. 210702-SL.1.03]MCB6615248.1 zinc-ribbon domain-containing protein [Ruminococcus sp. 210702-SL.1.03]